jgi:hypothetical protein
VAERRRAVTREAAATGQSAVLRQFVRADGEMRQRSRPVPVDERPPANSIRSTPR